ncbi:MAG: type I DNA topoisomerase [Deltaproteobacteria bacterium]|nr:type I DNA topoisomerase [Deltaproteobacteria bacterium]
MLVRLRTSHARRVKPWGRGFQLPPAYLRRANWKSGLAPGSAPVARGSAPTALLAASANRRTIRVSRRRCMRVASPGFSRYLVVGERPADVKRLRSCAPAARLLRGRAPDSRPCMTSSAAETEPVPAKKKTPKKRAKSKRRASGSAKVEAAAPRKASGKHLVIVESPAKAKTIKKYLGPGYTVKASVGHIRDLPKSKLAVDIDNGFAPTYELIRGKSKIIKEIKDAAKDVDTIFLAPDPDREGEAIAWHITEELGKRLALRTRRITFNEITKRAVQEAIKNPQALNLALVESQQARRILDRIVGYQISPILWEKVRRGLSAGRVQSVAVRMVVEREREIAAFKPDEYWTVDCTLGAAAPPSFVARVIKVGADKLQLVSEAQATEVVRALETATYKVATVTTRERRRRPNAPLITSKLQQEAANRLKFTAKRTMMVAQQLYEGVELGDEGSVALITYMRTDSTRVSNDALTAVRDTIKTQFGDSYVPAEPNVYKSKKGAQDAHEAIRPTSMDYPPEKVAAFLTGEQLKLYTLIWRSFMASQMVPAVYDQTTIDIAADKYTLRATGSVMKFRGFLAAFGVEEIEEEPAAAEEEAGAEARGGALPVLAVNDPLRLEKVSPEQHFTEPPPRFSESSLVKELEEKGIGRPSTYAAILSTIVARGYVQKIEGRFTPSELGSLVTDLLVISFPKILDVEFTAQMEELLDEVEEGKVDWHKLLGDFYHGGFKESLERAKDEMRDVKREEIPTEHTCGRCGKPMVIKWGRNGTFLACQGYPACRNTREYKRRLDGSIEIMPEQTTTEICPKCGGAMVVKRGRYGQFLACKLYPECKGTRPMPIGVTCPTECGGYVVERRSKRGRSFYGCSRYPDCTFASWDRPVEGRCPTCGNKYLVRRWTKKDGAIIRCPKKECAYQRDPSLDDEDARIAAGDA